MESTPGPQHEQQSNTNARSAKSADKADDKSASVKASSSAPRGNRYKEKFQALRDRYEKVTATHESYVRDLAIADDKVQKLQLECNLLLDAVDIAVPAQPSLVHYLSQDPIPPQYVSYAVPLTGPPAPTPMVARDRAPRAAPRTNGNGNGVMQKASLYTRSSNIS